LNRVLNKERKHAQRRAKKRPNPKTPGTEQVLRLLEEAYVGLAKRYGWFYQGSYYGAPIHVGGKHVWGKEGLFEELNKKLKEQGFRELTWQEFRELLKKVHIPGRAWVNWILAPNGKVEPHSITIMKPTFVE
jgi:ABC-type glycerol-3-phosphate transport system substrate-binding protein